MFFKILTLQKKFYIIPPINFTQHSETIAHVSAFTRVTVLCYFSDKNPIWKLYSN